MFFLKYCKVYGVTVPGYEGRCGNFEMCVIFILEGMASVVLGGEINWSELYSHISKNLAGKHF